MEDSKKQFIEAAKQATNILVTVRNSPSIDQLSACIALTLMLNAMSKHATAVFSGAIPAVLEFLEPEKTLQPNADSLQDFIISLDKAKADKLRYKVEDSVVKIFITPYRTSITDKDLEFGLGDFNVDLVVALGVHVQSDLDDVVTAHGRILHDATVVSINTSAGSGEDLGGINWVNPDVSSLSEMLAVCADDLAGDKKEVLDNQVATALLTGIVAETDRFGNSKTTPETMQASAKLLTAGANQELVATKLSGSLSVTEPAGHIEAAAKSDVPTEAVPVADSLPDSHVSEVSELPRQPVTATAGPDGEADITLIHEDSDSSDNSDVEISVQGDSNDNGEAGLARTDSSEGADNSDDTHGTSANGSLTIGHGANGLEQPADVVDEAPTQPPEATVELHDEGGDVQPVGLENSPIEAVKPSFEDDNALVSAPAVEEQQAYDLNQISVPASIPITPAEQGALASLSESDSAGQVPDAAQPAIGGGPDVDLVAQNQDGNTDGDGSGIQPLRDQNGFLGEPPLHDKKLNPQAGDKGVSVDETLDPTKFAVTPPSLGGTLTASNDQSGSEPPVDWMAANLKKSRSLMTHNPMVTPESEQSEAQAAADPADDNGLPQFGLIHAAPDSKEATDGPAKTNVNDISHRLVLTPPSQDAAVDTPVPLDASQLTAPESEKGTVTEPGTLAALETLVDSPHLKQNEPGLPQPGTGGFDASRQALEAAMVPQGDIAGTGNAAAPGLAGLAGLAQTEDHTLDMPLPSSAISPSPVSPISPVFEAAAAPDHLDLPAGLSLPTTPPPVPPPLTPLGSPPPQPAVGTPAPQGLPQIIH